MRKELRRGVGLEAEEGRTRMERHGKGVGKREGGREGRGRGGGRGGGGRVGEGWAGMHAWGEGANK